MCVYVKIKSNIASFEFSKILSSLLMVHLVCKELYSAFQVNINQHAHEVYIKAIVENNSV